MPTTATRQACSNSPVRAISEVLLGDASSHVLASQRPLPSVQFSLPRKIDIARMMRCAFRRCTSVSASVSAQGIQQVGRCLSPCFCTPCQSSCLIAMVVRLLPLDPDFILRTNHSVVRIQAAQIPSLWPRLSRRLGWQDRSESTVFRCTTYAYPLRVASRKATTATRQIDVEIDSILRQPRCPAFHCSTVYVNDAAKAYGMVWEARRIARSGQAICSCIGSLLNERQCRLSHASRLT